VGFEQYKTALSAFDRYYDKFLANNFRGARFKITLKGGDSRTGVPMAASIANPLDPTVSFSFRADDGTTYRIPFKDLDSAEELQVPR